MVSLTELFGSFAAVGAVMFGGGYSMLPVLRREIVEKRGWSDDEELLDIFAVAQCTPGVIAVNTATFIGYKKRGVAGAAVATLGVVTPSIIIILIIAALLTDFASIPLVQNALAGIRVAVCVLVLQAVVKLFSACKKNLVSVLIFAAAFVMVGVLGLSPVWPVLVAAGAGLGWGFISNRGAKRDE